jgi:hypothetical protein
VAIIEGKTNAVEPETLEKSSVFVLKEIFKELGENQYASGKDARSTHLVEEEL